MKYLTLLTGILLVSTTPTHAQSVLLGRNLFTEGTFDVFGESRLKPIGWSFADENDTPWKSGFRAAVVKGASGTSELRLVSPQSNGYVSVAARLPLPAKIERLRVSYRIYAKSIELGEPHPSGNGAGIYMRFIDESGKAISGGSWVSGLNQATEPEWADREQIFDVPETASEVALEVIFRNATGEVRVDDIELVPVAMSE